MDAVATLLALMFFGFITIVLLVIGVKTIRIVPQATVMLVERLGSFHHVAQSGLNILWPFIDRPRAVYWLSLIHISEPTRQAEISYAVFCLKKKMNNSY